MKRKAFIISALIAVLCIGFINEAGAQRWGHHPRGHAYGYYRHHPRVWVTPPPPRPIIVAPRYGYHHRYYGPRYYRPAPRYYGYYRPYHRRW